MANDLTTFRLPLTRGIISDLDGVVYRGNIPIDSAIQAFRSWQSLGIPFCFVTNNSTHTAQDVVAKLARMGLSVAAQDIITSASETARLVLSRWPKGSHIYVIGPTPLRNALIEAEMVLTAESPVAVVMGLDRGINHEQIKIAIRAVLGGAVLIGTNPDLLLPCDDGFEPGAGLYLTAVATATRTQPVIVGKPEIHLIRAALERLGTNPSETIMIGDQIPTDIQAGKAAGLFSVLVMTGVPPVNDKSLVPPDLVIKDLSEIAIVVPADQGEQHG